MSVRAPTAPAPAGSDAATAPPHERRPTAWWGMLLLIVTEGALFAMLIASYFYLRFRGTPQWPPDGIANPKLALPIAMTVLLASSSVPMWYAERSARRGATARLLGGLAASFALGAAFIVLQAVEYADKLDLYTPRTDAYGSAFFTITGLHGAHVVAGLGLTAWTAVRAARGAYGPGRRCGVATTAMYWHFVHGVWLVVFASLYLSPLL